MNNRHMQIAKKKHRIKRYWMLYFMMTPGLIYLMINNYIPMLGLFIAFKNVNYTKGIFASAWIGLKNFEFLFSTTDAWIITRNTILYNLTFIVVNLFFAVSIAILLNELKNRYAARLYQSIILFPYLISLIVTSYLVYAILSIDTGLLNNVVTRLGGNKVMWYYEAKYWPIILVAVNTWKQAGYLCIVYYAAIIGIDRELFEAAEIDGAGRFQKITNITLPSIRPVVTLLTLLQIGRIFFSEFGLFYYVPMDSGSLYSVTNVIDTYVYRGLMVHGNIGMASAAGLYQSVIGFLFIMLSNLIVRKIDPENALY